MEHEDEFYTLLEDVRDILLRIAEALEHLTTLMYTRK